MLLITKKYMYLFQTKKLVVYSSISILLWYYDTMVSFELY